MLKRYLALVACLSVLAACSNSEPGSTAGSDPSKPAADATTQPAAATAEPDYPQPAVIPHADLVIHHGGNNSFNESLYFGKPAIIMPFCWDGLDNAARIHDTGYGEQLPRYAWTEEQMSSTIARLLADQAMRGRLAQLSAHMQAARGTEKAANILAAIATHGRYVP